MSSQPLRRLVELVTGLALVVTGTSAAAVSGSGSDPASGTLNLGAELNLVSLIGGCAPGPSADECASRTISGRFAGLGQVTGTYSFLVKSTPPTCPVGLGKALGYPIRFTVASKGEIHVAVDEAGCVDLESIRTQTQTFTVTGGTGIYAGASGSGTLRRVLGEPTDSGRFGRETWAGTLAVPGLEFDLTAPTLSGAASRTVRAKKGAKSARVTYQVTGQDNRDGTTSVACTPKSGSRFRIGRTKVLCEAVDSSANSATASFTITVKKGR